MTEQSPSGAEAEPRNLVVIGASAGGVETLVRVVRRFPVDLPATVCVVLHISPGSPSMLPAILRRAAALPCRAATDGEALRNGEILVAPPDRHLVVDDGEVALTVGPRENGHRPSVDVLFRSAARAGAVRVIGVVLSGTRDDGTAGLAVIKECGGLAIVQDPEEALYPGMPASALAHVPVDAVVGADEVGATILRMLTGELPPSRPRSLAPTAPADPAGIPEPDAGPLWNGGDARQAGQGREGEPEEEEEGVISTCPECGGVLSEHREAGVTQWRCRVGHRYSPESLADAQAEGVEAALWAAVRALEDRQSLLARMAEDLARRGHTHSASTFRRRAREAGEQAELVRSAIAEAASTSVQRIAGGETVEAEGRRLG